MTFKVVSLVAATSGQAVTGALVLESDTHYQVGVATYVLVLPKDEWAPKVAEPGGFADIFGAFAGRSVPNLFR